MEIGFVCVCVFTYHCACYFAVSVFSSNIVFIFLSSIVNHNNNIRYQKLPKIKKDPREPAAMECSPCRKEHESET